MNTKVTIAIVAAVVIIGGGAAYFAMNQDEDTKTATQTTKSTSTEPASSSQETSVKGSLASIRSDGKARSCTFTYSGGSGTMYSDGKGRGLLTMELVTEKGNVGQSNTLTTVDKVYSWTKTASGSVGFVFDASTLKTESSTSSSASSSNTQNASQNFDLKCKNWNVDEAILTVPADVTFSTLPTAP